MNSGKTVLIVDDEERIRRVLEASLSAMGLIVLTASNGEEAIKLLDESVALILTDLKMSGRDGLAVLEASAVQSPERPVIIMTAFGTVDSAVSAMKKGAYDYVTKPFSLEEIELLVRRALRTITLEIEHGYLRATGLQRLEDMICRSAAMSEVFDLIRRVGSAEGTVLIKGETGTGKELVARAIHGLSRRRDRLFVPINCAAIPGELLETELFGHSRGAFTGATADRVGKFELASGGTLFLDEIGDMPHQLQAKLLRVLEEGVIERLGSNNQIHVDTRIVAATHRDLHQAMEKGEFREDLYYRLNVLTLDIPPLRDRLDDVGPLAESFLAQAARRNGRDVPELDAGALQMLQNYPWPGNVRELRNICERLTVLAMSPSVSSELLYQLLDVPDRLVGNNAPVASGADSGSLAEAIDTVESETIRLALDRCDNNKARTARELGISERSLWYKLKKYGLGPRSSGQGDG
ncbi:MAG TPA: sigma-54-dependent Fis family transcriptional regulator [Deltaproteobacteria bacterium]|nr:sigma-54-dependent Fis family transcriptional regulator [Candidatus Binatota bacterium]HIL14128.1 sigma-54-dependent Fis family transcriptional regulator [Deltaproteobacteria bacterium]